ncbi:MAG: MOSC N-terminal beta barrel domain-containing protein [Cyanobacteria bacterium P01_G01_bin.54]
MTTPLAVAELWVYPIKGCRGVSLEQAELTPTGLQYDRQWMIVNETGKFITQRELPQLAQIAVTWDTQALTLAVEDALAPCVVPLDYAGDEQAVQVWRSHTTAIDQGDAAAAWLSQCLGRSVRLVRQSPHYIRPINPEYAGADNVPVSFADGYPVLVTNTASLADLNERLAQKYGDRTHNIPMNRFRPNLVVASDAPFAEDDWSALQIGAVELALVKACDRCIVTTTDQQRGTRSPDQEPLKTLATFRTRRGQGILFGENGIPKQLGWVQVGDGVRAI